MKRIIIVCSMVALSACATMSRPTPDQKFEAYRAKLKSHRYKRAITAVAEQEKLRDRYWKLFGRDANSAGHFAFSTTLMRSAEVGDFPMKEAEALVAARENQLLAAKKTPRQQPFSWDGDTLKHFDDNER